MATVIDRFRENAVWRIHKWKRYGDQRDQELYNLLRQGTPVEKLLSKGFELETVEEFRGNVLLNEGIQLLEDIILGIDTTSAKWDSANARLGVGDDGTTAEDAAQTGLQGLNKTFKGMDAGYPSRTNQTMTWRSTFGDLEANHDWNEFTVVNAADDTGVNLNRKVEAKGTKSGGNWTLTLEITIS